MNNNNLNTAKDGNDAPPVLKFVIEGRTFESHEQYITDEQIRKIAGLPDEGELYLAISEPWQDEKILRPMVRPRDRDILPKTGAALT